MSTAATTTRRTPTERDRLSAKWAAERKAQAAARRAAGHYAPAERRAAARRADAADLRAEAAANR